MTHIPTPAENLPEPQFPEPAPVFLGYPRGLVRLLLDLAAASMADINPGTRAELTTVIERMRADLRSAAHEASVPLDPRGCTWTVQTEGDVTGADTMGAALSLVRSALTYGDHTVTVTRRTD